MATLNGGSESAQFCGLDRFTAFTAAGEPQLDTEDEELAGTFPRVVLAVGEDSREQGAGTLYVTTRSVHTHDLQIRPAGCLQQQQQPASEPAGFCLQTDHMVQTRSRWLLCTLRSDQHARSVSRSRACEAALHIRPA